MSLSRNRIALKRSKEKDEKVLKLPMKPTTTNKSIFSLIFLCPHSPAIERKNPKEKHAIKFIVKVDQYESITLDSKQELIL